MGCLPASENKINAMYHYCNFKVKLQLSFLNSLLDIFSVVKSQIN